MEPTLFVPVPDPYPGHILQFKKKFAQNLAFLMLEAEARDFFTYVIPFHVGSESGSGKRSGSAKAKSPGFGWSGSKKLPFALVMGSVSDRDSCIDLALLRVSWFRIQ